ncbi:DUF4386 domain-containing protein [Diaminobutyricimonas sp. LJ205]|uniref:DUF4386 domain-containing protein n=1 Tax=Diaminobutyricimonas sp. LJ205 TaxID=2683590 RepID=UPI0012F51763|nr:DUF4386 domain-containing protein [Diaminobutyricimonas sp. LJ205]
MTAVIRSPRSATNLRTPALVAGIGLLLMAMLAAFGNFGAVEAVVVREDAAATARNLMESEALFRVGIAALLVVVVLDIVVAWALFLLLEEVNRALALAAAGFPAAVFAAATSQLVLMLDLQASPPAALQAFTTFERTWSVALILFAVHLLLIGYLVGRSGFIGWLIGVLVLIAGLGYLVDSFGAVIVRGYTLELSTFTFVGEVALMLWLLIKGPRLQRHSA